LLAQKGARVAASYAAGKHEEQHQDGLNMEYGNFQDIQDIKTMNWI